jgi:hypothetical protein
LTLSQLGHALFRLEMLLPEGDEERKGLVEQLEKLDLALESDEEWEDDSAEAGSTHSGEDVKA